MHLHTFSIRRLLGTIALFTSVALVPGVGFAASAAPGATRAAAAGTARCTTSALQMWSGRWTVAAGTVAAEYGFTNRSSHACSLDGYPRVQLLKMSGANLPTSDEHASPGAFGISQKTVVLAPGKTAYFGVVFHDQTGYGTLTCPSSAAVQFTPPQDASTLTLHGSRAKIAAYGGATQHQLHCGIVRLTPVTARRFQ
jgi:hypothetical protein